MIEANPRLEVVDRNANLVVTVIVGSSRVCSVSSISISIPLQITFRVMYYVPRSSDWFQSRLFENAADAPSADADTDTTPMVCADGAYSQLEQKPRRTSLVTAWVGGSFQLDCLMAVMALPPLVRSRLRSRLPSCRKLSSCPPMLDLVVIHALVAILSTS